MQQELEAFFTIIETGTVSKAAEKMYISQPGMTRRIQNLEKQLGYTLFKRNKGKKRIELTEQGKLFYPIAREIFENIQKAKKIKDTETKESLRISSIGSVSNYLLSNILHQFSIEHKDIRLFFNHCHSKEAYQQVLNKECDLAIISDAMYLKDVQTTPLYEEEWTYVTKEKKQEMIHPSSLNIEKEIYIPWSPEFNSWHAYWFQSNTNFGVNLDQMSLLESFLSFEDYWAIIPSSIAQQIKDVHRIPVQDGPPKRIIYTLQKVGIENKAVSLFIDDLKKHLEKNKNLHLYI